MGNTWVLGYPAEIGFEQPYIGGSIVTFNNGFADTSRFAADGLMSLSSSISDENGRLLFYSNGCEIYNHEFKIIMNGNAIADGPTYDLVCTGALGIKAYNEFQGIISLPWPNHEKKYKAIYIFQPKPYIATNEIHTVTIDMDLFNGQGGVVEKNSNLFSDRTSNWFMVATRHGNGQDWWITLPEYRTNAYFVFLLDSLGIHGPNIQENAGLLLGSGGHGQSAFSPDGSRYAEVCFFQGQVLDFDRCTGKFSNPRIIDFETTGDVDNEINACAGVAFSPDSRFMYVSRCDSLFQYDMQAKDFNESRQTVAQFDGILDTSGLRDPSFYTLLNAPDGKIYMNSYSSTKALHVINHPNQVGMGCDFQKWGFELPTLHYGQLPNMPNFDLGAVVPSCPSCDPTLQQDEFSIFPNPFKEEIIICNKGAEDLGPLTFQLFDALGRLIQSKIIVQLPQRIILDDLPEAGYFYRVFSTDGKQLSSGKLIKVY